MTTRAGILVRKWKSDPAHILHPDDAKFDDRDIQLLWDLLAMAETDVPSELNGHLERLAEKLAVVLPLVEDDE